MINREFENWYVNEDCILTRQARKTYSIIEKIKEEYK